MKNNNIQQLPVIEPISKPKSVFAGNPIGIAKKWKSLTFPIKLDGCIEDTTLPEILVVTSFPPRECGIATYSQDLIKALNNKFSKSLSLKVCALESEVASFDYPKEVKYILDTSNEHSFKETASAINQDSQIKIVLIQHEFGFYRDQESTFIDFLNSLNKQVVVAFHTILPNPNDALRTKVRRIANACTKIVVMTHNSAEILTGEYGIPCDKLSIIAHGTHLVAGSNKKALKQKYGLNNRKVLSTFGLLSSGKSIETSLDALPSIIEECPEVMFLIIGKTHPEVKKDEDEKYRNSLEKKVIELSIQNHVMFINSYLELSTLLEYLKLTDIYLFTSNDPYQAVSGTFVYAMSCACPIISTPIPHAREVLTSETGIIFDFRNSQQLAKGVTKLLKDNLLRKNMSLNTLQIIVFTAWENSAVAHAKLFEEISCGSIGLQYNLPEISLKHLMHMTDSTGIIQFARINQPDIKTGYTLDDNARAMVAVCMHYAISGNPKDLISIRKYFKFIKLCQQSNGQFLNYVDSELMFSEQNGVVNLDDANGRAIWALGYLMSLKNILPGEIIADAEVLLKKSIPHIEILLSTRAMAFAIKGLYYWLKVEPSSKNLKLVETLANRLVQMHRHESKKNWEWFEGYLTYANSVLPEAMLYAWLLTRNQTYKEIAILSFNFLLFNTFNINGIEVISNKTWLQKDQTSSFDTGTHRKGGQQPIDVAYTIMSLSAFYQATDNESYFKKIMIAFSWFLGNNHLSQIIYNPCTGGCYDGLEDNQVNLNQGAESIASYLMARFTIDLLDKSDRKFCFEPASQGCEIMIHEKSIEL